MKEPMKPKTILTPNSILTTASENQSVSLFSNLSKKLFVCVERPFQIID